MVARESVRLVGQAGPDLRHLHHDGLRLRIFERACDFEATCGEASILFRAPHVLDFISHDRPFCRNAGQTKMFREVKGVAAGLAAPPYVLDLFQITARVAMPPSEVLEAED